MSGGLRLGDDDVETLRVFKILFRFELERKLWAVRVIIFFRVPFGKIVSSIENYFCNSDIKCFLINHFWITNNFIKGPNIEKLNEPHTINLLITHHRTRSKGSALEHPKIPVAPVPSITRNKSDDEDEEVIEFDLSYRELLRHTNVF